jgi:2-aminobenzoate-CoA ligase
MSGTSLSPTAHVDTFCRDNLPPEELWPELVADLPELDYGDRLNCAVELLDAVADRLGGERPCLLAPGQQPWTYDDLRRVSNQIARVLGDSYGIVPGNRVLLRGPNTPWLVACWFGVLKAGAVAVTTMPMLRIGEIDKVIELARVELALCDARFVDELEQSTFPIRVVTYGEGGDLSADLDGVPGDFDAVETAADDVALLAFTSGTTGKPKATMHFHRDVLAIADTFSAHVVKPTQDDVFTGTPPLAFTFGLGGLVVFPLRVGASTLLIERATPDELADLIAEHRVSVCFTAPTAYRAMIASGKVHRLATLRRAVSAGEHLPEATWRAVKEAAGVELIDGIGATEMLHVFIAASDDDIRPGSTGIAVPGYQAQVVDEELVPVPAGVPGRLAVKGPTGCRYLNDGRGRLLLVPGSAGRHDRVLGLQHLGRRGRGSAARASRRRGVRRRRHAGRDPRPARHRLRRASFRRCIRRCPRQGAPGLRQATDRAVQVPPPHRVRRGAAQDGDGQAAAIPS